MTRTWSIKIVLCSKRGYFLKTTLACVFIFLSYPRDTPAGVCGHGESSGVQYCCNRRNIHLLLLLLLLAVLLLLGKLKLNLAKLIFGLGEFVQGLCAGVR